MTVTIRVQRLRQVSLPEYAHTGDAGMDVVNAGAAVTLGPGERVLLPTGLKVEIPEGFEIQVRPRSGLALQKGLTVLNSPGTIDCGYRGEIGVILANVSSGPATVNAGERIAQLVLSRVEVIAWEERGALSDSSRGEGGFGSTG